MTPDQWIELQEFFVAVYGPILQLVFIGTAAGWVSIGLLVLGLALLRRKTVQES